MSLVVSIRASPSVPPGAGGSRHVGFWIPRALDAILQLQDLVPAPAASWKQLLFLVMGEFEEISHLVSSPLPSSRLPQPQLMPRMGWRKEENTLGEFSHAEASEQSFLIPSSLLPSLFLFLRFLIRSFIHSLIHSFISLQDMEVIGSAFVSGRI